MRDVESKGNENGNFLQTVQIAKLAVVLPKRNNKLSAFSSSPWSQNSHFDLGRDFHQRWFGAKMGKSIP